MWDQNDDVFFHCQRKKNAIKVVTTTKHHQKKSFPPMLPLKLLPNSEWTELFSIFHVLQLSSSHLLLSWPMLKYFSPCFLLLHFIFIVIITLNPSETACHWLKTVVGIKNLVQMNYFFWTKNCLDTKLFCSLTIALQLWIHTVT